MSNVLNSTTGATTRSARPDFFCTSGPLPPERPGYVRRAADAQVETGIASGAYVNIVGAPMTGKSSLLLRVADALRNEEAPPLVAFIDLNQLAQRDGHQDAARWFYAIAFRLARQLRVGFDLQAWWSENALLGHHHRFIELYREFMLAFPGRRIVLLFDGLHEVLSLDAGEQLLTSFRAAYDARATDPDMSRLSMVFAGNGDGILEGSGNPNLPYAISTELVLPNFTLGETLRLAPALGLTRDVAELAMQRIHDWVSGQPLLTQYLAAQLARSGVETDVVDAIDRIVRQRFELQRDRQAHAALLATEERVLSAPADLREQMLITLGRVAKQQRLLFDPRSAAHDRLLRAGALALTPDGYLIACSRLSRRFFNGGWANQHLPMKYHGLLKAAAVLVVLVAAPLWYRQYLPQSYATEMTQPGTDIETVIAAHERFSRWPGYADDAQRIAVARIRGFARSASDPVALEAALAPLSETLAEPELARSLRAQFWLREIDIAERNGDRAAAIHAALQAMVDDGLSTRRRLAALISTDLPNLTGVLDAGAPFDALGYRPRDGVLLTQSGTRVTEWARGDARTALREARTLTLDALNAEPAIERLTLPAIRRPSDLVLNFELAHERPADIELTITNPAGRSATVNLGDSGVQVGSNQLRLGGVDALSGLLQAQPAGEWALLFADTRGGIQGSVVGVAFDRVGVQAPDTPRRLVLGDPTAQTASRVRMDSRGLFAIAWPDASGNRAAVWDLRSGSTIASFNVSAGARFVGFSNADREAMLIDGVTLSAFRLSDGAPVKRAVFERPVSNVWLSGNGRWLAALQAEREAALYLFDLTEDRLVATVGEGIVHQQVTVSDDGAWIATADADRVVRLWRTETNALHASLAVGVAVKTLSFAPGAARLLVTPSDGGMLSWRLQAGVEPERWSEDASWSYVHDSQTGLSLVGSSRDGYRVHDFEDNRDRSMPVLGFAGDGENAALLRVRDNLAVISANAQGRATLWRAGLSALPVGTNRVRRAWLAGNGEVFAFADARDSFSVWRLDAGASQLADLEDDIAIVAHSTVPSMVRFSRDGRFAISVEPSGLFRVRHIDDGRFFDYIGRAGADVVDVQFSDDGAQFLLLREQALEVYSTSTGALLRREYRQTPLVAVTGLDASKGWLLSDNEGRLFTQSAIVNPDSPGLAQRDMPVDPQSRAMTVFDDRLLATAAGSTLNIADLNRRQMYGNPLEFASPITDMRFSNDGRYVVVRAGQWMHRVSILWSGSVIAESRLLAPDMLAHTGFALQGKNGLGVTLLRGVDEPVPATLWFDYRDVAPVTGTTDALRARWQLIDSLRTRIDLGTPVQ